MGKKGRPKNPERKIAIAVEVVDRLMADEVKVMLGHKPKFGRYQTEPKTKTVYEDVAKKFGVTVCTVQEAVRLHTPDAIVRLSKELEDKLDASDFKERHEKKEKMLKFCKENDIEIK